MTKNESQFCPLKKICSLKIVQVLKLHIHINISIHWSTPHLECINKVILHEHVSLHQFLLFSSLLGHEYTQSLHLVSQTRDVLLYCPVLLLLTLQLTWGGQRWMMTSLFFALY